MRAEHRLAAIRRALADEGVPAMLVTAVSNMRYLTGFDGVFDDGINAACLVTSEHARFYTDARYSEAAQAAAGGTPWTVRQTSGSMYIDICRELQAEGVTEIAIESSVPYGRFKFISEQFVGSVRVTDGLIEKIRQVKEAAEIERIQEAARLTDAAFEHVLGFIRPGLTELEVALELEIWMRANGSEGVAFAPIVASGPNSSRPHATVTGRTIERGDFVKMDFGACVGGYRADMTRTVVVGVPSERQREVYAAVLEANEAGLAAVRGGAAARDVDAAARNVLAARGLGDAFTHGVGHGVGLDIHELPTLNAQSRDVLRTGSVVTVEPGVYLEGTFGVRIEDLVVVEEAGCRVLTRSPKELIQLD
ncbi:Xaa-Pro peptidase family protein [Coriobacteriia bacterium Es71-Z0120]|uniref:M24 family metallopeptidase n=1 Tax=Parvivirga hydrogeniphila TaxID=2939460 RepID=UPI002261026F|nr:Xaa-Pro peptidase family protein [Parvivirga hydrogeniphila]MCL4079142.1 Xaa-Pro peptidase family protein [Parvivirga hydrogeniphila]